MAKKLVYLIKYLRIY